MNEKSVEYLGQALAKIDYHLSRKELIAVEEHFTDLWLTKGKVVEKQQLHGDIVGCPVCKKRYKLEAIIDHMKDIHDWNDNCFHILIFSAWEMIHQLPEIIAGRAKAAP